MIAMDVTTEKNCLEEISTLVLDANEKVSLKTISNNWDVPSDVASLVLLKWLDQNQKKVKNLVTEFVVRGSDKIGGYRISVVPVETKDALQTKWTNFCSMLYSVESRTNTRKLDLPDYEPIKMKRILLQPREPRDLHIPDIPVVKQEPTADKKVEPAKAKTPFSVMKPAVIKPEVKKETKIEAVKSPEKKVLSPKEVKEVKTEKQSPEDGKNAKGAANKKVQLKNQKPVQKGSISSFFSNKAGPSKATIDKPKAKPPAEPQKEEPKVIVAKVDLTKSRKRSSTPSPCRSPEKLPVAKKEAEKKKKPAAKKMKLKEKPNNKRSRIRVMQDSSEEEEEKSESDEPETKFIKFDREFTPETETSPVKPKESPEKQPPVDQVKHKAKRWVTKRFQTEDGFVRTERVQEEYSASEGENEENRKKNSPPKEKAAAEKKSTEKKTPAAKAKPAAAVKGKQGNIASFFTKK